MMIEVEQTTQPVETTESTELTPEKLAELATTPADDLTAAQKEKFLAEVGQGATAAETPEEQTAETPEATETPSDEPIVELDYNGEKVTGNEQNVYEWYEDHRRAKEMQADYTRKTQALAEERKQYNGIVQFIQKDQFVARYMGMVFGGIEPDRAMELTVKEFAPTPEPPRYITDEETGQKIPNMDYLVWQQNKVNRPARQAQAPQQQPQSDQPNLSPIGVGNGVVARSAAESLATKYGYDISTRDGQDRLYDMMEDALQKQGIDFNRQPLTQKQYETIFEQMNPTVVKKAQQATEAKKQSGRDKAPIMARGGTSNGAAARLQAPGAVDRSLFS